MSDFSSETITEISKELLKAQEQMRPVTKDATNPFLRNRYASLAAVLDAVRRPLLDNNIVLVQRPVESEPGTIAVETRLVHVSGEWISSTMIVPLPEAEASSKLNLGQAIGAAFTYGKRYSLMGMLGVSATDEDSDCELRSQSQQQQQPKPRFQPPQARQQEQPTPTSSAPARAEYPGLPAISGVTYEEAKDDDGNNIVIARGQTLPNKDSLKRLGFRWSSEKRIWCARRITEVKQWDTAVK